MFSRRRSFDEQEARRRMVREQIAARGIADPRVLTAMVEVPRHEFVPADLRDRAYEDSPLPIGWEQTISQPYIVARMSELLELTGRERVLEIGAGCGYQSAVLGRLAAEVCALELEPELAKLARDTLERLHVDNVDLRQGDGFEPWPGGGEFDAILCACAPLEVPEVFAAQLAEGGRLVLPTGISGGVQVLRRLRRDPSGRIVSENEGSVRFVPMRHPHSLS